VLVHSANCGPSTGTCICGRTSVSGISGSSGGPCGDSGGDSGGPSGDPGGCKCITGSVSVTIFLRRLFFFVETRHTGGAVGDGNISVGHATAVGDGGDGAVGGDSGAEGGGAFLFPLTRVRAARTPF
jgi:hypothetical protein